MTESYDYGSDSAPQVTASGFEELDKLIRDMRSAEHEVEEAQEKLKSAQQRLAGLSEQAIPEMLDTMGLQEFKTRDGFHVSIKTQLRHSLSRDRKAAAIQWLRDNGHGDIVKDVVKLQFGVGEETEAQTAYMELLGKFGARADRDADVHSATLKSVLLQLMKEGKDVPLDVFGAFEQRQTIIKEQKKK